MSPYQTQLLICCLVGSLLLLPCESQGPIVTEQNTTGLSIPRLLVQLLTEPENLLRFFEGWDVVIQMMKSWGKSGAALATLPFNKEYLYHNKDFVYVAREIGPHKSGAFKTYYYAQVPTRNAKEAPRFIKMTEKGPELKPKVHREPLFGILGMKRKNDTPQLKFPSFTPHGRLSNEVLARKKRSSTTEIKLKPIQPLPLLLKQHLLKKDKVEKIVDFLNEALEFLDLESS